MIYEVRDIHKKFFSGLPMDCTMVVHTAKDLYEDVKYSEYDSLSLREAVKIAIARIYDREGCDKINTEEENPGDWLLKELERQESDTEDKESKEVKDRFELHSYDETMFHNKTGKLFSSNNIEYIIAYSKDYFNSNNYLNALFFKDNEDTIRPNKYTAIIGRYGRIDFWAKDGHIAESLDFSQFGNKYTMHTSVKEISCE